MTRLAAAGALALAAAVPSLSRADAPAGTAAATPTTAPATRPAQEIGQEYMQTAREAAKIAPADKLADASARAGMSAAVPLLKKQVALLDELAAAGAIPAWQVPLAKLQPAATIYLLDPQVKQSTDAAAKGDGPAAMKAASTQYVARWMSADKDGRSKIADDVEAADKQHPESTDLTSATFLMAQMARNNDDQAPLADRLTALATDTMKNDVATIFKQQETMMAQMRAEQAAAEAKLKALEGKPLVVSGQTVEGKTFTTADWKGKVVMVDFWATWCGPCIAGLPEVKATYAKFHPQGLEMVGVSNDFKRDALTQFTAKEKMPWPELFDQQAADTQQWNPITLGYGVRGIPRMFLIDKKGVLRTIEARSNMGEMIPKLLAE